MNTIESVVDIDRDFLWRYGIITLIWMLLFTIAAIVMIVYADFFRSLFF